MSRATIDLHLKEAGQLLVEVGRHVDAVRTHLADDEQGVIQVPADATLKEMQRWLILTVLQQESGHVTRTARRLHIARRTVQYAIADARRRDAGPEDGGTDDEGGEPR